MGLETGTYVNDLVISNPVGSTDSKSQGDNHLRLIKSVLKATFPNATRALYFPTGAAEQTATVNVAAADQGKLFPVNAEAAARTVNLPASPVDGFTVTIIKNDYSLNAVTIAGNGADTINGSATVLLTKGYQQAKLVWNAATSAWYAQIDLVIPTGTKAAYGGSTAPTGWIFANGVHTIGSASSAATVAAASTLALFTHLWNTYADAVCSVSGGRGASAAADFAANKRLTMPDLRGATIAGATAMGGVAESTRLTDAAHSGAPDVSVPGAFLGTQVHTLTLAEAPAHDHGGVTGNPTTNPNIIVNPTSYPNNASAQSGAGRKTDYNELSTVMLPNHVHTIPTAGGGGAHENCQPSFIDNWIIAF